MKLWQKKTGNTTEGIKLFKYALMLSITFFITGQAWAQLEMRKHTINSGGNAMSGGGIELKSSIGQVDASGPSNGGNLSLNGGFWQQNNDLIFKNKFQ